MRAPVNRGALWATCVLVLVPTTLAALALTTVGLLALSSGVIYVVLAAGWFGIVVLWQVFIGLMRGRPPKPTHLVWAGLASGSLVSLYLATGGLWLFGWPLIAAVHLGTEFSRASNMGNDTAR
jgi:hypothetical protein